MYTMAPKLRNSKKTVRLKVMILSMLKRRLPFPQFFGSNRIKLLLSLIMFFGVWLYDEECNCFCIYDVYKILHLVQSELIL